MSPLQVMGFDVQQMGIKVAAWVMACLWALVLFTRLNAPAADPAPVSSLALGVLGLACCLAVWQSVVLGLSWRRGAHLLRARQVPSALWRLWMKDGLLASCRVWAVLAVAVVSVMLPANSPWDGFAALALLALVICLSLVGALAADRYVHRHGRYAIVLMAVVWFASGQLGSGFFNTLHFLNDTPTVLLLVMCVAVPGLLAWLWHRWSGEPPKVVLVAVALPSFDLFVLVKSVKAWFALYVPLALNVAQPLPTASVSRKPLWLVWFIPGIFVLNGVGFARPFGSTLTVFHILMSGLLILIVTSSLVCKGLHWRMVLAPGGLHRGRLGWHIAISTATIYLLGFALVFGLGLAIAWLISDHAVHLFLSFAARFAALPVELIFAIAVATLLRGTGYPAQWFAAVLMVLLLAGTAAETGLGLPIWEFIGAPVLIVDLPYLLSLLVLAALALWASNKLWTVERLLQSMPRGA